MTSYIFYPATNTSNATYVFAIPPSGDEINAIIGVALSALPFLFLPKQIYNQYQEKKNKPKVEKESSNKNIEKAKKRLEHYLIILMILWLISMAVSIVDGLLYLTGEFIEPNNDNTVLNSLYSFWLNDIGFAITFGIITILVTIWFRIIIGIHKHKNEEISTIIDNSHYLVMSLSLLLAVVTIASLAAIRPYCFPSFQRDDLNEQCVSDNTDVRIFQYRWIMFGVRLFVCFPVVVFLIYVWNSLRPGPEVTFLHSVRQMMEILMIAQLTLYLLQTIANWVAVFYPDMTYSDYKNLKFYLTTIPNILILVGTMYYAQKIKSKEEDPTKYQELDSLK